MHSNRFIIAVGKNLPRCLSSVFMFVCLIISLSSRAQQLSVKSFEASPFDLSASVKSRLDSNRQPCSLVKVMLTVRGATFEGCVVGDVQRDGSDYWVYLDAAAEGLQVKHPDYGTLAVSFSEFGVQKLQPKVTYLLQLAISSTTDVPEQTLTVRVTPVTARVVIDNKDITLKNGIAAHRLAVGEHSYRVEAEGYSPQSGTVVLKDTNPGKLIVELEEKASGHSVAVKAQASNGEGMPSSSAGDISSLVGDHEYVDLGLPSGTLWAKCNVGASTPENFGFYFAWGETKPQSDNQYSRKSYKWGKGKKVTKYCTDSKQGEVDFKVELDLADDAAAANWGGGWRMPSLEQMDELVNPAFTRFEWVTQKDVPGLKITSLKNGNSVFFPAASFRYDGQIENFTRNVATWSRTLVHADSSCSYLLSADRFVSNNPTSRNCRYMGHSVRPVCKIPR